MGDEARFGSAEALGYLDARTRLKPWHTPAAVCQTLVLGGDGEVEGYGLGDRGSGEGACGDLVLVGGGWGVAEGRGVVVGEGGVAASGGSVARGGGGEWE